MTQAPLDVARETLRDRFGHADFRPGQARAVEAVLAGRDTLVILPTGGGKSVCYQVPAMQLPGLTVVLSPLISLMKDQVDALDARGIPATFINSSLSQSEIASRLAEVHRGAIKLLYLAPERFDAGTTADRLRTIGVSLLAIDEAHCVSQWGHDFRKEYLELGSVARQIGGRLQTIAFTATADAPTRTDIVDKLFAEPPRVFVRSFDRPNLRLAFKPKERSSKQVLAFVRAHEGESGIVYCASRRKVEELAQTLREIGRASCRERV